MKPLLALAAMLGAVSLVSTAGSATPARRRAIRPSAARTVWDSVYSDSQAMRGDSLYKQACSTCHGPALAGTDSGAPLTGKPFLANWNGLTVGDLYDRVRNSMPPANPKSIPRPQVADILAYMLAQNHFPSGAAPLPTDADKLQDIKIAETRP